MVRCSDNAPQQSQSTANQGLWWTDAVLADAHRLAYHMVVVAMIQAKAHARIVITVMAALAKLMYKLVAVHHAPADAVLATRAVAFVE